LLDFIEISCVSFTSHQFKKIPSHRIPIPGNEIPRESILDANVGAKSAAFVVFDASESIKLASSLGTEEFRNKPKK
jgi:hypothetical protein